MATHFALLIGNCFCPVTDQATWGKPLKGCVRDVIEIKEQLAKSPVGIDIKVLAAGPTDPDDPNRPNEVEGADLPTHINALRSLERITSCAADGNFVYIHFSGHSTAISPDSGSPFSNGSTGDLALVLLASDNPAKYQYLRGLELAYQLKAMVDKGLKVTLVLDCCVSGSAIRDKRDPSVRYLPYDRDIDLAHPPILGKCLDSKDGSAQPSYRDASLRPNWLVDPDGYTILTACGPREKAMELKVGSDEWHGVLSHFLTRAFIKYGRVGGWQHHIYAHLCARFREKCQAQHPMLYGNMGLWFFGDACATDEARSIAVVWKKDQREPGRAIFQLEAGEAHGISKGDRFALHGVIADEEAESSIFASSADHQVVAEVTEIRPLTSELTTASPTANVLGSGPTATAISQLQLLRLPVRLDLHISQPDIWLDALKLRKSLSIVCAIDGQMREEKSFAFHVKITKDRFDNAEYVLDIMEHLAKFRATEVLTNKALAETTCPFRTSFNIQVVDSAGTAYEPGCRYEGPFASGCSHQDCVVTVNHGETIRLEVQNNEAEEGRDLYVHLYDMARYSWGVSSLSGGDYLALPPRYSRRDQEDFPSGTTGEWKPELRMEIPNNLLSAGHEQCEETIKVILTSAPTSFMCLELPEITKLSTRGGKK
ncbi:caspase, partial [Apiospora saccharicola]